MTLKKLLSGIEYKLIKGDLDVEITDAVYDSRKVTQGAAFVCIHGFILNSHEFIDSAIKAGATAIIISEDVEVKADVTVVRVADGRDACALMAINFYENPAAKLKTIAITGTKGKTTTTHMLKEILETSGKKTGLIGTNGVNIGDKHIDTNNTTPEAFELQKYLRMMVDEGCDYALMEASSTGIKYKRMQGMLFDVGAFLNISPDHIGGNEHKDFDEYLSCKSKIFSMCKEGFANLDDDMFEKFTKDHTCGLHTFSTIEDADYTATNIRHVYSDDALGEEFTYNGKDSYDIKLNIPGVFNVKNALAAASIAEHLGIDKAYIKKALAKVKVDGRMQLAHVSEHCTVIIDYAHNGVSTRSLLETLRRYNPKRLVVVFGCGGNKAKERRYEMGEAVGELADLAVVTTDNPREENPDDIVKDIHKGLDKTDCAFVHIPDRREAIYKTIADCNEGDMIAIIGKGHEDYQEVRGVKTHLSDSEEVEKTIKKLGW